MTKFLLGFGIGVGLAMLFAPASGEETRGRILHKAQDLSDLPRKKAAQMADMSKEKAGQVGADVGRRAAEGAVEAVKQNLAGDQTA